MMTITERMQKKKEEWCRKKNTFDFACTNLEGASCSSEFLCEVMKVSRTIREGKLDTLFIYLSPVPILLGY